jgi:hypothetical protein
MDPLLALETSSAEGACWLVVVEADREAAVGWVRRAEAIAAGYALAAGAGRAEFVVCEVACALQVDQLTAERVLREALLLAQLPQVVDAVEAGALRLPHARVLLEQLLPLEPALAARVADDVLSRIGERSPSAVRAAVRRAVLRADPGAAERRRQAAVAERTVFVRALQDGMASLELQLRAETALRVYGAADEATRGEDGSGRNADQRRVDWLVEQILGDRAAAPRGGEDPEPATDGRRRRPVQVQVVVPVAVALGLSEEPCELVGHGPISAEHGRELLADAELRKVCVDERTGQVVAVDEEVVRPTPPPGTTNEDREQALAAAVRRALVTMVLSPSYADDDPEPDYRPSARLARTVRLRDVTCDFPYSSTSAERSDLDHTEPWPRGQTALPNLGARSRRIHRAKQAGWTPRPLPDGSLLWQSPSGASYRRPPPRERPPAVPPGAVLPPPRPPARAEDPPPRWVPVRPGRAGDSAMPAPPPPRPALPDEPPF